MTHYTQEVIPLVHRYINPAEMLTFDEVSVLLQLGSKYQIERMKTDAIRRLKTCFPDNLEDFVNARTDRDLFDNKDDSKFYQSTALSLHFSHCRDVITLARRHDLDSLLPSAFYAYAQMKMEGIINADAARVMSRMSNADRARCVNGRFNLKMALRRNLLVTLQQAGISDCLTPQSCTNKRMERTECLCDWDVSSWALMDKRIFKRDFALNFCATCTNRCTSTYDKKRQETWTNLRAYFDLPPLPT